MSRLLHAMADHAQRELADERETARLREESRRMLEANRAQVLAWIAEEEGGGILDHERAPERD